MKFCTAINCIDGRVQLPVIEYLQTRFDSSYVDMINEPGVCSILSKNADDCIMENIFKKVEISINRGSFGIAIVGHYDCKGNPVDKSIQVEQIKESILLIESKHKDIEVIGLWVDENFNIQEVK